MSPDRRARHVPDRLVAPRHTDVGLGGFVEGLFVIRARRRGRSPMAGRTVVVPAP
ncbi:hypothetical protein ACN9M0_31640 [Streptomyces sp. R-07]|uniref:hypothetical protein n=1 Tax=Streptomyces sp. R-07 TaxID=3404052 RepID=UPI003CFAE93D